MPMTKLPLAPALLALLLCGACSSPFEEPAPPPYEDPPVPAAISAQATTRVYPEARRAEVTDEYHGQVVADPYRWLEDSDSQETRAWIEAQNELTSAWLAEIPGRDAIATRLEELWNYERYGIPHREGERIVFSKNDGLQNQSVLYVLDEGADEARVLLDPNTLTADGTMALSGASYSHDGTLMAYGLAEAGSDWNTWKVRDVGSGEDLPDTIHWVKFSGASWNAEGTGFFYSRYDEPTEGAELQEQNFFQKVYFHTLGTEQAADQLVYERPDQPEWSLRGMVSEDGRWLVIHSSQGTDPRTRVFYKDLADPEAEVVTLLGEGDASYSFIGNEGSTFWFETNLDAPLSRVIAIDVNTPEPAAWTELIPEAENALRGVSVTGGHFVCSYLKNAYSQVRVYDLAGAHVRDVEFPGIGTARGFGGEQDDPRTWYAFSSYANPGSIMAYDVATGESSLYRAPELAFDPADYVTQQLTYASVDGTPVTMFVSHRADLDLGHPHPTLLYGYGGFNIPLTPSFSPARLHWMELGGVFVVANLRGGSEYGEEWHQAGMKLHKQNVFDDFISAGESLIARGYTTPDLLAINGGSNGGLLVGACVNQRPDLFGAAIPAVGVMDMLRFHLFTIGWAWVSDYGSVEDADEFAALCAYSPYHNTVEGTCYPHVMVTTSDHDDRVVPAHSFKYAAALQNAQGCDNPVLIRIETRAGHGAGKPTSKRIEQAADEAAFLLRALGVE